MIPPRRGWIVDRHGAPIANNRTDFRVDIIPDRLQDKEPRAAPSSRSMLDLTPDEVAADRRRPRARRRVSSRCRSPRTSRLGAVRRGQRAPARTARRRADPRAFARNYPAGAAVGHLTGYVGAPHRPSNIKATQDPLLVTPGFKIGKDGLEKALETRLRGKPGAKRVEVTARGKLVRELATRPDVAAARRCA